MRFNALNEPFQKNVAAWVFYEWREDYEEIGISNTEQTVEHLKTIPCWVATDYTAPMGCVCIEKDDLPNTSLNPWISSLYVDWRFRGRGVGTALLHTALKNAPRPVYLWCQPTLTPWYRKHGFEPLFQQIKSKQAKITIMHFDDTPAKPDPRLPGHKTRVRQG